MAEEGNISNALALDAIISTCLRSLIAGLLLENGLEDVDDLASLSILEHIMLKLTMKHGALTQSFAEHAMRSQAHFADAVMAVAFTGVDISRLKTYAKEFRFPRSLEGTRLVPEQAVAVPTPKPFQSGDERKLPRYIQDYFPPMPIVYTFESTPVQKQNKVDYKQAREKLATERRQVEKSLVSYHLRYCRGDRAGSHFDSPFQLDDPCFSLLPATYGLETPSYIPALVSSKFEDRLVDGVMRPKESEGEKAREDAEEEAPPRKYRRQGGVRKNAGAEKRLGKPGRKPGSKAQRNKEETEESNSASGLFSPGM